MSQVLFVDSVGRLTFHRPEPHLSCQKCPKTVFTSKEDVPMYTLWKNESIPTRIAWDMAERVPRLLQAIGPPLNFRTSTRMVSHTLHRFLCFITNLSADDTKRTKIKSRTKNSATTACRQRGERRREKARFSPGPASPRVYTCSSIQTTVGGPGVWAHIQSKWQAGGPLTWVYTL